MTANYNFYSAAELEKALKSWVEPYPKPIILNHDLNSEPIGRVIAARMDKEADGSPFIRLQVAITDPQAAQKIADKRYLTGSVGGRAGKAVCSISGEDLASESTDGRPKMPKYRRGQVYKGKLAYIDMQDISFKEYSFVNQPADQRSSVRSSKEIGASAPVADSDNWTAKANAFILKMNEEDIISIEENESILKGLKKKESRPLYLQIKGAFLSALAFHESETDKGDDSSLLFKKNINNEEILNMDKSVKEDDVLAAVEGLSQDLSKMATETSEPSAEPAVEQPKEEDVVATETPEEEIDSTVSSEEKGNEENSEEEPAKAEEQSEEVVDSVDADESKESSEEKSEEKKEESEESKPELTDENGVTEQLSDDEKKLHALEEENKRLKQALHRTLVERVVDTKIAFGMESVDDRDSLIADHSSRTASSLADTLRDIAKMPVKQSAVSTFESVTMETEVITEKEDNVVTIDADATAEETITESKEEIFEDVLVDALMGRRKL